MAYYYSWTWTLEDYGDLSVSVTDDGSPFGFDSTADGNDDDLVYSHHSLTTVFPTSIALSSLLSGAFNALSSGSGTYTVTLSESSGYTVAYDAGNFGLTFSGTAGANLKRLLGFSGDKSGASSYSSDVRPYFLIVPVVSGATSDSDEMEVQKSTEAVADDGSAYVVSPASQVTHRDWTQAFEEDSTLATHSAFGRGTYLFARSATAAVPWTWQDAFSHSRAGQHYMVLVDGADTRVHRLRADGMAFRPVRAAGPDYGLWSVPLRTRQIGVV